MRVVNIKQFEEYKAQGYDLFLQTAWGQKKVSYITYDLEAVCDADTPHQRTFSCHADEDLVAKYNIHHFQPVVAAVSFEDDGIYDMSRVYRKHQMQVRLEQALLAYAERVTDEADPEIAEIAVMMSGETLADIEARCIESALAVIQVEIDIRKYNMLPECVRRPVMQVVLD